MTQRTAPCVVRWRRELLLHRRARQTSVAAYAGFGRVLSGRLAADPDYDLHALIELVERGCRPDLAVRILAPLDEGLRSA